MSVLTHRTGCASYEHMLTQDLSSGITLLFASELSAITEQTQRRLLRDLEPLDLEIERTARHLRREARNRNPRLLAENNKNGEIPVNNPPPPQLPNRIPMRNYATPTVVVGQRGVQVPAVATDSFEIKHGTIQLVQNHQFGGGPTEDPHGHLCSFEKVCNTFRWNGVSEDAIKLRLFPFSLRDRATTREENLPPNSINTWDEMVAKVQDTDELRQIKAQLAAITNQLKGTSIEGQTSNDGMLDQFSQFESPEQVNFLQNCYCINMLDPRS
ncbi:hypothetical protein L6452_20195 [Arctium lappa]|uniref:Uncharacterized protein n=1 Tax=Arctium lappa TaxID=4217 RepID=A0ACB9BA89_ARCLA|nr:hypothetical protein L6452_20195 [Arctium lappa]